MSEETTKSETILTGNVNEPDTETESEIELEVEPEVTDEKMQMRPGKMPLPAAGVVRSYRA